MTIWFCTACGTPSGSTASTCPHCGTPRPSTEQAPGAPAPSGFAAPGGFEQPPGAPPPGFEQPPGEPPPGFQPPPGAPPGFPQPSGFQPPPGAPHPDAALFGLPPLPPPGPLGPQMGPPPGAHMAPPPGPLGPQMGSPPGAHMAPPLGSPLGPQMGPPPGAHMAPPLGSPLGPQMGPPPVTAPSLPEPVTAPPAFTGPMPVAQYEVIAPGQHPDGPAPNYAPPGYEPGYVGYQQGYDPNNAGYQPAPAFVPAEVYGPPPPHPGSENRRRWWVPVLVAVVVLLAIGAIATVVLVDGNKGDDTANPGPTPTPAESRQSASASASPSPTPTPSSAPPRLVTTDPSVTDSRVSGVADMFEDYFTSINNRDFDQALTAYDPAGVINPNDAKQAADFKQAISTTTDSAVVLRSIGAPTANRPGALLDARVTFRSNQQPGFGPRERPNEPCTAWDVTYTLSQPGGGTYKILIGKASNSAC